MSITLDQRMAQTGTRFLIFPQPRYLPFFEEPEVVYVSVPPQEIQPGPADDRMYVVDAVNKQPYSFFSQPPYRGPANPPIMPGPDGHFDHLDVNNREFSCATMYATVRRVLDIWEDYFGRRIEWHFRLNYQRLELIPLITWDNAQSGYGFLEFGYGRTPAGGIDRTRPYCQNFDVLAHELGHSIIFAEVGTPNINANTDEYGGFHESAGDLVAMISSLHFNKLVERLLENTKGNLFTTNELNRIGELSENRQIRELFNYEKMSTVSQEPHELSLPLTGAIFDVFVEVFQRELVQAGLISEELARRSFHAPDENEDDDAIQAEFTTAYSGKEEQFKDALFRARDYLGAVLAEAWNQLSANNLTYARVGLQLMNSDVTISGGEYQNVIRDCFAWREISLPANSVAFQIRRLDDCGLMSYH
ncbi:conserved hypothetical protein [Rippkaea orientalis PCC 8801]|uniref:Peptidase M4 C-terminal domain-containing protein n=1 Tax=Rippkaea orientalis (strain PCC 8801 / RF-1) TaxID=41431 RepID=B7K3Q6_RIPO1|nr:hypothetical protein [Rippkaea orientalis]ACK65398.1 conserved hypothetical protein [Rippkaea orientalis PCC 8801]